MLLTNRLIKESHGKTMMPQSLTMESNIYEAAREHIGAAPRGESPIGGLWARRPRFFSLLYSRAARGLEDLCFCVVREEHPIDTQSSLEAWKTSNSFSLLYSRAARGLEDLCFCVVREEHPIDTPCSCLRRVASYTRPGNHELPEITNSKRMALCTYCSR